MIENLTLTNFKAHRNLELPLERLTVLVGPNASGKTSILEALSLLDRLGGENPEDVFRGESDLSLLRTRGSTGPVEVLVSGTWDPRLGPAGIIARPESEPNDLRYRKYELMGMLNRDIYQRMVREGLPALDAELGAVKFLRLDAQRLAEPSYSGDPVPVVAHDGTGLASVLADLKLRSEGDLEAIQVSLKKIVPAVERIRLERAKVFRREERTLGLDGKQVVVPDAREYWGNSVVFDMMGAKGIPASAVGEGTLLALGLLTVLKGPQRSRLVLLDDIELALHPRAQEDLIGILRDLMKQNPELQVVATSHSPFILDYLKPEEVRLTALAPDGTAHCRRLVEHPDFARWKGIMRPGEFWSTIGEKWVLEGTAGR